MRVDDVVCNDNMYATSELLDQKSSNGCCAITYDQDSGFGEVSIIDPSSFSQLELLPSQRIDPARLSHLNTTERKQLLTVIDKFADVFSDTPGLCPLGVHIYHTAHAWGIFNQSVCVRIKFLKTTGKK